MDNNLIEYKLNLIQKMRLSISKRFVTLSSYAKYPDYLTQDDQIISQLLHKYRPQDIMKNEKLSDERKKLILKVMDRSQTLNLVDEGILNNDFIRYLYENEGMAELIPYLEERDVLELFKEDKIDRNNLTLLEGKPDKFKAKLIYMDAVLFGNSEHKLMDILHLDSLDVQVSLFRELEKKNALPENYLLQYPEIIGRMKIEEVQKYIRNGLLYEVAKKMDYETISKLNIPEKMILGKSIRGLDTGSEVPANFNKFETLVRSKKIEHYMKNYSDITSLNDILQQVRSESISLEKIKNIEKVITNPRIMKALNADEVTQFLNGITKDPEDPKNYEMICGIVKKAYGEEAVAILRERPELTIGDIPNFDIFDERIRETIGYGGVHTFLTYYMDSEAIISEMVKKTEFIEEYKEFERITGGYFPSSAIGLEDRLITFYKNREIVAEMIKTGNQDRLKDDLLLSFRDREFLEDISLYDMGTKTLSEIYTKIKGKLNIFTLEDLEQYNNKRNQILDDSFSNPNLSYKELISLLQFRYFGHIRNESGQYMKYDHKKFLEDYLKFNVSEFSEDEIDLIELYSIIEDSKDPNTLRRLNELMKEREDVITPLLMKSIDSKVVESYKREYMNTILNLDKARKMVADPNNPSIKYVIKKDGTKVYADHIEDGDDTIYADHIKQRDGTLVYTYDLGDGQIVKKHIKENNVKYTREDTEVNIENGEISDYMFYNQNTVIARKKGDDSQYKYVFKKRNEDGTTLIYEYNQEGTVEILCKSKNEEIIKRGKISTLENGEYIYEAETRENDGGYYTYRYDSRNPEKAVGYFHDADGNHQFINGDWKSWKEPKEQLEFISQLERYKSDVEQYLYKMVDKTERGSIISAVNPAIYEMQDGDVEVLEIHGAEESSLFYSLIRGNTSGPLKEKRLARKAMDLKGKDFSEIEDAIYMQQNLEGGIASISHYYNRGPQNGVGLAYTKLEPNAIIKFSTRDGATSHGLKELRIDMPGGGSISSIISELQKLTYNDNGEVATLRYQYDISQIVPRNRWWKKCSRIYC